ncbi:hypothetical protein DFH27DRAFT_509050 [Peziza echinospora]|nr:hypothetical protein DFH27DRAFT_509050 [Peziza echinospora]
MPPAEEPKPFLAATRRLLYDLKEIKQEPVSTIIHALPLDWNIFQWHGNLRIEELDLTIHFQLLFTQAYPMEPPSILLYTALPHPNVHIATAGYKLCLDMLEGMSTTPYKGWSPSYSARSILLQLGAFIQSSTNFVNPHLGDIHTAKAQASTFHCTDCGYNASAGVIIPPFPTQFDVQRRNFRPFLQPSAMINTQAPPAQAPPTQAPPTQAPPPRAGPLVGSSSIGLRHDLNFQNMLPFPVRYPRNKFGGAGIVSLSELQNITIPPAEDAIAAVANNRHKNPGPLDYIIKVGRRGNASHSGHFMKLPYELIHMILLCDLAPRDIIAFSGTCRYLHHFATDGYCWKKIFSTKFPTSDLQATKLQDWMPATIQEINFSGDELKCYVTKATWVDDILGVPITYTRDAKTGKIDFVKAQVEFLSRSAFMDGCRTTIWNHRFQAWCPIYINREHFQRALPDIKSFLAQMCLNRAASSDEFSPEMAIDVFQKTLNTYVSLILDRAMPVSARAIEGYFIFHRLLLAMIEVYPSLETQIDTMTNNFMKAKPMFKKRCIPSLANHLPLLGVSKAFCAPRADVADSFINEWFDRQIPGFFRAYPELEGSVGKKGKKFDNIQEITQKFCNSTKVGRRVMAFHLDLLQLLNGKDPLADIKAGMDVLYGHPPRALVERTIDIIKKILAVPTVPPDADLSVFPTTLQHVDMPRKLASTIRKAIKSSIEKGYYKPGTDYSQLDVSPVSMLLLGGERFSTPPDLKRVVLTHNWRWDPRISHQIKYLDAICSVFNTEKQCLGSVDYTNTFFSQDAIIHSGDTLRPMVYLGEHTITLNITALSKLPAVKYLVFSAAGWGYPLRDFKNPEVSLFSPEHSGDAGKLCHHTFKENATAGDKTCVVMCILWRRTPTSNWDVKAVGQLGHGRVARHGYVYEEEEMQRALALCNDPDEAVPEAQV